MFGITVLSGSIALFGVAALAYINSLDILHPLVQALGLASLAVVGVVISERRPIESGTTPTSTAYSLEATSSQGIRALVVGAGHVGRTLAHNLEADGRYNVVGFVDDHLETVEGLNKPILGDRYSTAELVAAYDIQEVFLAYAPTWQQKLAEDLTETSAAVTVNIVPTPFESLIHTGRVENAGDIAFVRVSDRKPTGFPLVKRGGDLLIASIALLMSAPLSAAVWLLIKLTSAGPAVFAQERVGRNGKNFTLYKFRTMYSDAEVRTGPVLANGHRDNRLTPVGKWVRLFRIDEIPQLWNVLKGEMSLIGPRPERPMFVSEFAKVSPSYCRRHDVRPGITGLAQVRGGYHTDWRDKLRFDLYYITHQSIWLDLRILLKTFLVVLLPDKSKQTK